MNLWLYVSDWVVSIHIQWATSNNNYMVWKEKLCMQKCTIHNDTCIIIIITTIIYISLHHKQNLGWFRAENFTKTSHSRNGHAIYYQIPISLSVNQIIENINIHNNYL